MCLTPPIWPSSRYHYFLDPDPIISLFGGPGDYSRLVVKDKILREFIYYYYLSLLSLYLSRHLLFILSLILYSFNISIYVLYILFFYFNLKSFNYIY